MAINSRGMMARLMSRTSVTGTTPLKILVTCRASMSGVLMRSPYNIDG